jgi:hypothetical protein
MKTKAATMTPDNAMNMAIPLSIFDLQGWRFVFGRDKPASF